MTQDLGNTKAAPGLMLIARDEKRFRFFRRNGKPAIPLDAPTTLTLQTSYERAREAMQAAQ